MLASDVSSSGVCRLEGHWTKRTLVEDFAVFLMNVHFQHCKRCEDNSTVDTPGGQGKRTGIRRLIQGTAPLWLPKANTVVKRRIQY